MAPLDDVRTASTVSPGGPAPTDGTSSSSTARGWNDRLSLIIATFFGTGLAPVASGTVGSLAAVPLAWAVSLLSPPLQIITILVVTAVAIATAHRAGQLYGVVDSGRIVIDEVAGLLVALIVVPFTLPTAVAGFALFRLFDIAKPWPVSFFDRKVRNGAGVVLDDVVAGMYARVCLALLMLWFPDIFGVS